MQRIKTAWRWSVVWSVAIALWVSLVGWGASPGYASPASPSRAMTTVEVHLGTEAGALIFEPDQFQFEVGQRYKLVLSNPSPQKHYFTAKDFADAIWTQKVDAGNVEIKGAIHELELRPGAIADWVFIPQKPGVYELHCSIPGHREAGMTGQITVVE